MTSDDLAVLRHLRLDSRKSLAKISRECGIPAISVYNKIKLYENSIISKYTSLLNFDKMGLYSRVHIIVKLNKEKDGFIKFLNASNNINSVYRLRGNYNFYIEAIFKHELDANDFVKEIKDKFEIQDIIVHDILEDIQKEMFLVK